MHQPLCIDYPNVTLGIRELSAKTYIKWINTIPHCHHEYSITRHISSVLESIKVFNPIKTKYQREKLNSSQQDREEKRHMIQLYEQSPRYIKIVPSQEYERERERLNTYLLVQTLSPEGGLLARHRGGHRDDEDGHRWWFPPLAGCRNKVPFGFWWLHRIATAELPI